MRDSVSEFGSWQEEESLEPPQLSRSQTHGRHRAGREVRPNIRSPTRQRPASATVRVPYMPSHLIGGHERPKRRPRSAAPPFMRATFSIDSALQAASARHHLNSAQEAERSEEALCNNRAAKYVLEQNGGQGNQGILLVPRPRQGFGVRTATARRGNQDAVGAVDVVQPGARFKGSIMQRPSPAPARFFGRRSSNSHKYERAAPGASTVGLSVNEKRRQGIALKYLPHQKHEAYPTRGYYLGQKLASPTFQKTWGARNPNSTATVVATTTLNERPGYYKKQSRWGGPSAVKYSKPWQSKKSCNERGGHSSKDGEVDGGDWGVRYQFQSGENNVGDAWVGLLERSYEAPGRGVHSLGGRIGGGSTPGLAINPSPWGAFLSGPSTKLTIGSRNMKRPSSAPRRPPSIGNTPRVRGIHARARPKSAYAASPFRKIAIIPASENFDSKAGDSAGDEVKSAAAGGDVRNKPSQKKIPSLTPSLENLVEHGGGASRAAHYQPSQSGARAPKGHLLDIKKDVELLVVAEQVEFNPAFFFQLRKGDTENDLRYRIGMPVIPAFWPRMASAGGVLSSATSPPPTPSPPLRTAVPGNNGLGLFGSALVPAGNGTELPWSWTRQRRRQRPRMVERRPIGFLYKRTVTVDGPDYSESTSRRVGHALFEMESKESGAGRAVHNARVGLVGKALHVLKCHHQANLLKGAG